MKPILLLFTRTHVSGLLAGITTHDRIRHVDRWHAAQWVKGVRRNSKRGRLDYKLSAITAIEAL
jgi:hypothetical protein